MSIFDNVAFPKHKRNVFNLSHEHRTSAAFGQLIPVFCEEVLPGDTWQINTESFIRAMPMLAPLMHRVNIYTHFFFVPNRLVWDDWKDFITGGEDGTANPEFPQLVLAPQHCKINSLADHLGVGVDTDLTSNIRIQVNALPFRAYQLIWNEYYRDQNLQDEIEIDKSSGIKNTGSGTAVANMALLRQRNWEKDYFTSALPWTQRGPQSVIPIADEANVVLDSKDGLARQLIRKATSPQYLEPDVTLGVDPDGALAAISYSDDPGVPIPNRASLFDPNGTLKADLSNATATSINELRRAIALQRWLETNARGGARYIEQIFSHFGVVSSDARLQRPEFLGGGRQPLSISEVLQTSQTTDNSDLGDMAGHGISASRTNQFRRYFEEHGFIIGIMSIMPKSSYGNGTRRFMHKFDRFDYAFPEFANLGEQEVWNSEVFQEKSLISSDNVGPNSGTFGYQSRYAEYKYIPNTIHGELRTEAFSPWTLFRQFDALPNLNSQFVTVENEEDNLGRIFPITDSDTQFIVQMHHNVKAVRILPKHVIPSI